MDNLVFCHMMALFYSYLRSKVRRYKDILLTIIASKSALKWCKDIAKHQAERQRPPHLPGQNITNEQGTYDPEAIKKFHYNVAEAQLELHRQNVEWCIGTIAKARNRHVDVEPEVDERPDMIWG